MAVRATTADVISYTRSLIGDPAGASQVFSNQDVQDALDRHVVTVRYESLRASETILPGGVSVIYDYYSDYKNLEASAAVVDKDWNALTPATADYREGHFTFSSDTKPPVYLKATSFDVYAAAVDLLEMWQAKVALEYNFSADGQSFSRAQKTDHLAALADRYRRRVRPVLGIITRSDLA